MKIGIVTKLFVLTTLLCMLILAMLYIGQTIFFKQYYANQKVNEIQTGIETFSTQYLQAEGDEPAISKLEQDFYREYGTWITTLDHAGNIRFADDFSINVQVLRSNRQDFSDQVLSIPLYGLIEREDISRIRFNLEAGNPIYIDGIVKDNTVIPVIVTGEHRNFVLENRRLSEELFGKKAEPEPSLIDSTNVYPIEEIREIQVVPAPILDDNSQIYIIGEIEDMRIPELSSGTSMFTNHIFIERIKQFQKNLLFNEERSTSTKTIDFNENDIHYKIFVKPIKTAGETVYIIAMTSLQPVDEAVQVLQNYYVYLIAFVLILSVLASLYYSKKIAKPLLRINDTTNKMAGLDFSETIPIKSNDEIGTLSHNINTLSTTLHSYINQLQQDIEKEKQLENVRKEFIAGVSHELKTPLSVMKSCITIIEDGVAENKKEYYFNAMTKEVDKMDRLIVDMLELAKFESGTYKMAMDAFYIDDSIEYVCEQLSFDIAGKQLHVHKKLSKLKVMANQHRIEQVITNFITNAIRYTNENKKIIITAVEENERVKISVENTGEHIAEEHLEKIWDRFYRAEKSRKRSIGGTGLGLAISKNILELHDAEYGATNTEEGVQFYFYLKKGEIFK